MAKHKKNTKSKPAEKLVPEQTPPTRRRSPVPTAPVASTEPTPLDDPGDLYDTATELPYLVAREAMWNRLSPSQIARKLFPHQFGTRDRKVQSRLIMAVQRAWKRALQ